MFPVHRILSTVVQTIESYQKAIYDPDDVKKISESDEVVQFLDVARSLDLGVDSLVGSFDRQDQILDLTPDCKYIKYAKTKKIENFWNEKAVTSLLKDVFTKKTVNEFVITPKMASFMLGVSIEMVMTHRPKRTQPLVS